MLLGRGSLDPVNDEDVMKILESLSPVKGEMVDNLIKMLEAYATDLEGIVGERTAELEKDKTKVKT